jgi:IS1 family transposase
VRLYPWTPFRRNSVCCPAIKNPIHVPPRPDGHTSTLTDFATLVKVYGVSRDGEQKYSPGEVVDSIPTKIIGNPDSNRICTSHIERQNLSIRMGMRRMTRLTNGFSKKWENLEAAYALWFAYYNFCRVHQTLRVTPAMESGLASSVWELKDLIAA